MNSILVHPKIITIDQLTIFKDRVAVPIDGLNIPYITVPYHLANRKRQTQREETINILLRKHFNLLSPLTVDTVRCDIKETIKKNAKTEEDIISAAEEILQTFLLDTSNINDCISILDYVRRCGVMIDNGTEKNPSKPLGLFFVGKCGSLIIKYVDLETIKEQAELAFELDDLDQLDIYNREREKVANLTQTICSLYMKRNVDQHISVSSQQVFAVLAVLINNYNQVLKNMTECEDDYEKEMYENMIKLIAERFYNFLKFAGSALVKDQFRNDKGTTFQMLITKFKEDVMSSVTDDYLKHLFSTLKI